MRVVTYKLDGAIRIVSIDGETQISVATTGDYFIAQSSIGERRIRSITLADTGKAKLTKSPRGMNRTLSITLASEEASEEEFMRQARKVFCQMKDRGNA